MTGIVRIGLSGWTYAPWRGVFYPKGLPRKAELAFAAARFSAIEINGTFYSLQRPESFGRWRDETPEDFMFAVKGPRFITHMLKLRDAETALANFFASGLLRLGPKLGPILWQFPPRMAFDMDRFESFFKQLPRTTEAALALARRHGPRVSDRSWLHVEADQHIRHAVEIRHDSFRTPAFVELLREHDIALVCADTVDWPLLTDLTADFIYCRLHGSQELYVSGYDAKSLDHWARLVRAWRQGEDPPGKDRILPRGPTRGGGRDVFVFFDNDAKVRAPLDAAELIRRVGSDTPLAG
ncbi:MAG TPA: DUF72 domain-containing protein [Caulobacteraceae bacterium]|jgi:uncharacterized protein YecE (DUF72 family)|nr:DUF72 domain-containing protein [Caulobacteraceae bacterium]